ncbi:N-terminal EF-hand calcium-binding protein 1 isoform X3 [Gallus gallus]|uniref:N-terminal EF-hand calcium-binding protein 1 isoform X3 n=1 Tax=Gallus gallus TaxID=9031 RepID=UPI001AEAC03F|nr:N-terminal EF-hand calcium-binding protein 1 isoform X3 [Gallus gallus]XP_046766635.1 N-terminal EF-hand calcium-binding protein 1 isoform X3 [Gallus gallus]
MAAELGAGLRIFRDILRRADKNDGKLSFDEFKAYFADGVLSGEELHELFHTIDTHNTDNLDTEELCEYFSQHLGEYENVLSVLEDLNITILKAMDKTKKKKSRRKRLTKMVQYPSCKDYQEASNLEQFVTRFLLKETLNQLQSLQASLECAMETTEEQTRQESLKREIQGDEGDEDMFLNTEGGDMLSHMHYLTKCPVFLCRQGPTKPEVLSVQWPGKRSARRLQRNNSISPTNPQFNTGWIEEESQWMTQISRLQKLIDRLEKKDLKLEPFEEEVLEENARSHIMIVQRQMSVIEEEIEEFRLALKQYVESASAQSGCLHVSIQKLPNDFRFIIYEFWENSNVWNSHLQMNYSKTFQRSNVDFLETPELITTMLVPASWWVLNNN